MDKLLSSLLCCSVDSQDDSNTKVHQSQVTNNTASKVNAASRPKSSAMNPAQSKTNQSINTTSSSINKHEIQTVNVQEDSQKKDSSGSSANVKKSGVDDHEHSSETDGENFTNESDTITNTTNNNDIITQVPEDGSVPRQPIIDEFAGEDDLLDLTRLQEGQVAQPDGWLLAPQTQQFSNKKCLVLDLDETLVHSSFKYLRSADFVIPVEIDNQIHNVYVIKRPGVDEFIRKVGEWYEVVVFTASVSRYGDPLLDRLDKGKNIHHRLFRESCYNYQGNYIKNLSQIGRPLSETIIIDNSPASYIFHPQHAIPISSWFSDTHDNELVDLLPFLEDLSRDKVDDVSLVLDVTI